MLAFYLISIGFYFAAFFVMIKTFAKYDFAEFDPTVLIIICIVILSALPGLNAVVGVFFALFSFATWLQNSEFLNRRISSFKKTGA